MAGILDYKTIVTALTFVSMFVSHGLSIAITPDLNNSPVIKNSCPRGFEYFQEGNACFFFTPDAIQSSWEEANTTCARMDAHLAVIPDRNTSEFLTLHLVDSSWIGLSVTHVNEKVYTWIEDKGPMAEDLFDLWAVGHPTGTQTEGQCVFLNKTDHLLYDKSCNGNQAAICQADTARIYHLTSVDLVNQTVSCPHGWVLYRDGETCLHFGQTRSTWPDARKYCQSQNGDLVIIPNSGTNEFIKAKMPLTSTRQYWIGLSWYKGYSGLHWVNWKKLGNGDFSYWASGEPNKSDRYVRFSDRKGSKTEYHKMWVDVYGFIEYKPICEKGVSSNIPKLETDCPEGWIFYPGATTCFKTILSTNGNRTWDAGQLACTNSEGHLAIIKDAVMESFIKESVLPKPTDPAETETYWIGLRKTSGSERSHWLGDHDMTYTNWHYLVSIAHNGDLCGAVNDVIGASHFTDWTLVICDGESTPLCQRPVADVPKYDVGADNLMTSQQKVISKATLTCPHNSVLYERGKTCFRVDNQKVTWATAKQICASETGHLAKINDLDTWAFVKEFVGSTFFYIGLTDVEIYETFKWEDGEIYNQDVVKMFIENNRDGFDFVGARDGGWMPFPAHYELPFICQYDPRKETLHALTIDGKELYMAINTVGNRFVPSACEEYGMYELFLHSDAEFHQLKDWLNRHLHVYKDNIWLKTRKTDWETYYWRDGKVGVKNVWANDTVGNSCHQKYPDLQACCTMLYYQDDTIGYRLQEEKCDDLRLDAHFFCGEDPPPAPLTTTATMTTIEVSGSPTTIPTLLSSTAAGQQPAASLPPLPPSSPLSPQEKQEFTQSLNYLKSFATADPSSSPSSPSSTSSSNSTANKTIVQNKLCPCACAAFKFSGMPSPSILASMVSKIQQALLVETVSLSSRINKKSSAKDDRPSSQNIAIAAAIFASIPVLTIVGFDLIRVYQYYTARG